MKNEIESHLRENDRSLVQIQADLGKLNEAAARANDRLIAIQATLGQRDRDLDRVHAIFPETPPRAPSPFDPLLAERIAAISKSIDNVAEKMQREIDIRLTQTPTIDLKKKDSDLPPTGQVQQDDKPLQEAADELIEIESKLLDPKSPISRRSRETLLPQVLDQLRQIETLRSHSTLNTR